jgi:hypothetical protein
VTGGLLSGIVCSVRSVGHPLHDWYLYIAYGEVDEVLRLEVLLVRRTRRWSQWLHLQEALARPMC